MSGGELCLLQHEVDGIELMSDKMMGNEVCKSLIQGDVEYEVPAVKKLGDYMWKGKADIVNHEDKLVVDLKTTADINKFRGQHLNTIMTHKRIYTENYSVTIWSLLL